jgi:hypothetical protein
VWQIHCQPLCSFFQTLRRDDGFRDNRFPSIVSCTAIMYVTTMFSPFIVDLKLLSVTSPKFRCSYDVELITQVHGEPVLLRL